MNSRERAQRYLIDRIRGNDFSYDEDRDRAIDAIAPENHLIITDQEQDFRPFHEGMIVLNLNIGTDIEEFIQFFSSIIIKINDHINDDYLNLSYYLTKQLDKNGWTVVDLVLVKIDQLEESISSLLTINTWTENDPYYPLNDPTFITVLLIKACEQNKFSFINKLLTKDKNHILEITNTHLLLFMIAKNPNLDFKLKANLIRQLLSYKPKLNVKDQAGNTILHYIAKDPDSPIELIQTLMKRGARTSIKDRSGKLPFDYIAIEKLAGLDVPAYIQHIIKEALIIAINANAEKDVASILKQNPDLLKPVFFSSSPFLHIAIKQVINGKPDSLTIVEHLVKAGADISAKQEGIAVFDLIDQLVQANINESAEVTAKKQALHTQLTEILYPDPAQSPPDYQFLIAIRNKVKNKVEHLLEQKYVDINRQEFYPLHTAIEAGSLEIVKVLIKYGADIFRQNNHGTALEFILIKLYTQNPPLNAMQKKIYLDMIDSFPLTDPRVKSDASFKEIIVDFANHKANFLIKKFADAAISLDASIDGKYNALDIAVRSNDYFLISFLIEHGVTHIKNDKPETDLSLADKKPDCYEALETKPAEQAQWRTKKYWEKVVEEDKDLDITFIDPARVEQYLTTKSLNDKEIATLIRARAELSSAHPASSLTQLMLSKAGASLKSCIEELCKPYTQSSTCKITKNLVASEEIDKALVETFIAQGIDKSPLQIKVSYEALSPEELKHDERIIQSLQTRLYTVTLESGSKRLIDIHQIKKNPPSAAFQTQGANQPLTPSAKKEEKIDNIKAEELQALAVLLAVCNTQLNPQKSADFKAATPPVASATSISPRYH